MNHTHVIDYFGKGNGPVLMRAKKFGENIVPFGCYMKKMKSMFS